MRIREITLREVGMKLIAPFEISSGVSYHRRILLLEVNVDGVTGWGECVAGENPELQPRNRRNRVAHHSRSSLAAHQGYKTSPAQLTSTTCLISSAATTWPRAALKPRSGTLKLKQKGIPLWKLLGGSRTEIACGVSIGITESLDSCRHRRKRTRRRLSAHQDQNQARLGRRSGRSDCARISPKSSSTVDANSAYTLDDWNFSSNSTSFT